MFNLNWFKEKKPVNELKNEVLQTVQMVVPVKKEAYHEIIPVQSGGYLVRVYSRKDSTILAEVNEDTLDSAKAMALTLLRQNNGV